MAERRIDKLSDIELASSSALVEYARLARDLSRDLAFEFDMSASELEARLQTLAGHQFAFGMDSRLRARQVAVHIGRASDAAQTIGIELIRARESFKRHFNPDLQKPTHKGFDLDS